MIYAIRAVGTEFVKIGYTTNYVSSKRMKQLQTGCPYELEVLAFAAGTELDEIVLHNMLKQARLHVRGEWFKMGEKTEQVIKLLINAQIPNPLVAKTARNPHRRLGAALSVEYREPASYHPKRPANPAGATTALQPDKGSTPTREG